MHTHTHLYCMLPVDTAAPYVTRHTPICMYMYTHTNLYVCYLQILLHLRRLDTCEVLRTWRSKNVKN